MVNDFKTAAWTQKSVEHAQYQEENHVYKRKSN